MKNPYHDRQKTTKEIVATLDAAAGDLDLGGTR